MKNRPSVNLHHGFDRRTHSEWTLIGLARDIGARVTSDRSPDAVENEYRRSIILSLDYVPGL